MRGSEIEPVDVITFGSPCQDMSLAGKRAGLDGSRSSLFYEAIRIVKEMRCKTNGKYPRYIVWENVTGAFSSNKGEDFRAVLEAVASVAEEVPKVPMPEKGGWPYADVLMGDGWSIAYRTFDAQYWGVPQRRRRIYLVADFGGECAKEILFESEGMSGNSPKSGCPGQRYCRRY
jgi:DNA (cytosine-5)-methyltransferase 1